MARRKKTEKRELSHEDIPRNTRATAWISSSTVGIKDSQKFLFLSRTIQFILCLLVKIFKVVQFQPVIIHPVYVGDGVPAPVIFIVRVRFAVSLVAVDIG